MDIGIILGLGLVIVVMIVLMVKDNNEKIRLAAEVERERQMALMHRNEAEAARKEAANAIDVMREKYDEQLKTGIKKSRERQRSAIKGQMAEQIAPLFKEFGYNPKDARFMGSPIDFVVFDGMSKGQIDKIVFVEVKTGKGVLSKIQRNIRGKVLHGRVEFEVVNLPDGEETSC